MDMLSYSKEREPAIETTDLNAVVRDVLELLEGRAKEMGVTLESTLDANLPTVPGRSGGHSPALLNIVGNALDAVEDRPSRRWRWRRRWSPTEAGCASIVVDNGVGIPPEKIERHLPAVRQHQGVEGHRPGPGGQPQDPARARRRHPRPESPGKGSRFILRLPLKSPLSQDVSLSTSTELPTRPPEPD